MQNLQTSPKRFISRTREIAEFLGRSERSCYHILENGKVPGAKKVGGTWMLTRTPQKGSTWLAYGKVSWQEALKRGLKELENDVIAAAKAA